MKELKFFIDCSVFDRSPQGTTTYIAGLYTELIKNKEHHFYFASHTNNFKDTFGEHDNVTYLKYTSNNKYVRLLIDIPRFIKKLNIDYAHFQYIIPPITYCKYIVTIHDVLFLDFPKYFPLGYKLSKKYLFEWSIKRADIVLTVSEYSKNSIVNHFNRADVTITPNAVDPVFFEDYDKKTVAEKVKKNYGIEDYFLFISRWEPRKNHDFLLKVFVEKEYYKNHHLVFIGEKAIPNRAYLDYFETLNSEMKEKIIDLNKLEFNELVAVARGARLSIYPSIAEGFGIPPLEASAAGIPSICSNATAMSDFYFLEEGLFNSNDENDLNRAIVWGLKQEGQNSVISSIIKEKYNWEIAAEVFLKAINENQQLK
ncbi:glycosyltransferase family 4 protein [Flavobacterium sp. WC2430]|uniref:glycosyltransferase family 4 protein n=1 Tax=Flavobacterium sp. WC2430 TaxID=3234137 RepID=UPI0034663C2D